MGSLILPINALLGECIFLTGEGFSFVAKFEWLI